MCIILGTFDQIYGCLFHLLSDNELGLREDGHRFETPWASYFSCERCLAKPDNKRTITMITFAIKGTFFETSQVPKNGDCLLFFSLKMFHPLQSPSRRFPSLAMRLFCIAGSSFPHVRARREQLKYKMSRSTFVPLQSFPSAFRLPKYQRGSGPLFGGFKTQWLT